MWGLGCLSNSLHVSTNQHLNKLTFRTKHTQNKRATRQEWSFSSAFSTNLRSVCEDDSIPEEEKNDLLMERLAEERKFAAQRRGNIKPTVVNLVEVEDKENIAPVANTMALFIQKKANNLKRERDECVEQKIQLEKRIKLIDYALKLEEEEEWERELLEMEKVESNAIEAIVCTLTDFN
jgi:hypothetical protein